MMSNRGQGAVGAASFTPGGLIRLRRRLAAARAAYAEVCEDNPAAAEAGDNCVWHDNFAYEENQRRMHMLAKQVRELENLVASAWVQPLPREEPEWVALGHRVRFVDVDTDETREVWIAGFDDGDPGSGRISYNSPLGRALVGARLGDVRELRLGRELREIEIVAIACVEPERDAEHPNAEEVACAAA